jgi:hypothetical protein
VANLMRYWFTLRYFKNCWFGLHFLMETNFLRISSGIEKSECLLKIELNGMTRMTSQFSFFWNFILIMISIITLLSNWITLIYNKNCWFCLYLLIVTNFLKISSGIEKFECLLKIELNGMTRMTSLFSFFWNFILIMMSIVTLLSNWITLIYNKNCWFCLYLLLVTNFLKISSGIEKSECLLKLELNGMTRMTSQFSFFWNCILIMMSAATLMRYWITLFLWLMTWTFFLADKDTLKVNSDVKYDRQ